jgi:hypothetical protein
VDQLGTRYPWLRGRVRPTPAGAELSWADVVPIPVVERSVDATLESAVRDAGRVPMNLRTGPLARVEVVRTHTGNALLICVHHIVFDGASFPQLLAALRQAYAGTDLGAPVDAGELAAFSARQRAVSEGEAGAEARDFWRDFLGAQVSLPVLASGGHRAAGGVVQQSLPAELIERTARCARTLRTSRFALLFAAFLVLLRHHAGHDSLCVSIPFHGRKRRELRSMVGFFSNELPIRQDLTPDGTFAELVRSVVANVRAAIAHGELPMTTIRAVSALGGVSRVPISFQHWDADTRPDVDVTAIVLADGALRCTLDLMATEDIADHDLAVMLREDRTGTTLIWKDPEGEYGADLLGGLAAGYRSLLAELVADPHRPLSRLSTADIPTGGRVVSAQAPVSYRPAELPETVGRAPATATARVLAGIWTELLNTTAVDADSSFFGLGGGSLQAARMAAAAAERLAVTVSLRTVFSHPRLQNLADVIDELRDSQS